MHRTHPSIPQAVSVPPHIHSIAYRQDGEPRRAEPSPAREAAFHLALSSATRVEILRLLRTGPRTASQLASRLSIGIECASYHLGMLRRAKLVSRTELRRKRGRPTFVYEVKSA